MKRVFNYHGHAIVVSRYPTDEDRKEATYVDQQGVVYTCVTCSLPFVIVKAVAFMVENSVRSLVVDGVEIKEK